MENNLRKEITGAEDAAKSGDRNGMGMPLFMKGNRDVRIARLEHIKAFNQAAIKNLEAVLTSALETDESRKKARRELLNAMETLVAAERELVKLKAC